MSNLDSIMKFEKGDMLTLANGMTLEVTAASDTRLYVRGTDEAYGQVFIKDRAYIMHRILEGSIQLNG